MKNLKSLQALALAGVGLTFMATGCSSTGSHRADAGSTDETSGYRMSSALGSVPITDVRLLGKFPTGEWGSFGPVAYESYTFRVPVAQDASSPDLASADTQAFDTSLQPGDTFVEAAGANNEAPQVKRVIRYSPFSSGH